MGFTKASLFYPPSLSTFTLFTNGGSAWEQSNFDHITAMCHCGCFLICFKLCKYFSFSLNKYHLYANHIKIWNMIDGIRDYQFSNTPLPIHITYIWGVALAYSITTQEIQKSCIHLKMFARDYFTCKVKSNQFGGSPHCQCCSLSSPATENLLHICCTQFGAKCVPNVLLK